MVHTDAGHGRIEERHAYVCSDLSHVRMGKQWPGLGAVGMVTSTVTDEVSGRVSQATRYYLLSDKSTCAARLLQLVRGHWSVESMHWVLDVTFNEDGSRILDKRAAQNFGLLRRTVLGMVKAAPPPQRKRSSKGMSLARRRRHCGWRPAYRLEVVAASLPWVAESA